VVDDQLLCFELVMLIAVVGAFELSFSDLLHSPAASVRSLRAAANRERRSQIEREGRNRLTTSYCFLPL
jgi:hypothetical protein